MKLANAIAQFLKGKGITHVFTVSGGANLRLIHGIAETEGIALVCPQTEQAAGFAADAYARLTGLGCSMATSGPGATNLVTAIATSYYDSVPVLYIAGQVSTGRMTGDIGVRQLGFQETPIVPMVKGITKFAVEPMTAGEVLPLLHQAVDVARFGRKGPVLVSIPDDLQRAEV